MKKVLFILLALSFSSKVVCSANALASMEEREFPVIETFVTETDGMYNTPAYLYNVKANKFFVGANEWGTRASVGSTGWKVKVLKHLDSQQNWDEKSVSIKNYVGTKGWYALGFINDELWTDCASQRDTLWTILKHGDYYRFEASTKNPVYNNFSGTFLGVNLTEGDTRLYPDKADTKEDMIDWAIVTEKRYEGYQRELLIYNKAQELKTWIEKCDEKGLDASGYKEVYQNLNATMEELENAIAQTKHDIFVHEEENASVHNPADMTSQIVNPSYDNNRNDGWEGNKFYTSNNVAEYYERNFTLYQDLANLPKGVYAIQVQAFCRNGWAEGVLEQYENGEEMPTRLYAGTKDFATSIPIKNICEGMSETSIEPGNCSSITDNNGKTWYIPNNMEAAESFFNDAQLGEKYVSTLIFGTDGDTIRFGLQQDKLRAGNWVLWDNWKLTYYGNQAEAYQLWLEEIKKNAPDFEEDTLYTKSMMEEYRKVLEEKVVNDYASAKETVLQIEQLAAELKKNIEAWKEYIELVSRLKEIIDGQGWDWTETLRNIDDYLKAVAYIQLEKMEWNTEEVKMNTNELESMLHRIHIPSSDFINGTVWSYIDFNRVSGEEETTNYTRYKVLDKMTHINRFTYYTLVEYNTCEYEEGQELNSYLVRMEDHRFYILKKDAPDYAKDGIILKEVGNDYLLYDFNLQVGEEFCKYVRDENDTVSITVKETSPVTTIDGYTFTTTRLDKSRGWWIDRFGSTQNLLYPFLPEELEPDCDCGSSLNYAGIPDHLCFPESYKNPFGNLFATSTAFKPNDCALGADAISSFVNESKVWHCLKQKQAFTEQEDRYYYFQGDTVINDISAKKMYLKFSKESTNGNYQAALYEDEQKVYCCYSGQKEFELLYDFGAKAGEEITISNVTYLVENVEKITVKNETLRVLHLKYESEHEQYQFTWVEGFGGLSDPCYSGPRYPGGYENFSDCEIDGKIFLNAKDIPLPNNITHIQKNSLNIYAIGSSLLCTSPTAVKMEVYTMDAIKVGESTFANGEAAVKVNKTPATYLYIVTYPDGRRESGKVMVK